MGLWDSFWDARPWNQKKAKAKPKARAKPKYNTTPYSRAAADRKIAKKSGPIKVKTVTKKRKDGSTYKAGKVVKAKRKDDWNYSYHTKRPAEGKAKTIGGGYGGGGGGYGGGGGGGGGGSSSASSKGKSSTSKSSSSKGTARKSMYGDIYGDLNDLMKEYQGIKIDYTPGEFDFRDFEGMDKYKEDARRRVESDTNANVATLGNQKAAANRAYEQSLRDMNLQSAGEQQAIGAEEQQALGRLQAMASNMGMSQGMGAMSNNMGVVSDYQNTRNQNRSEWANRYGENAMNRANALGEVDAQEAAIRLGQFARTGELSDQLGQAGWDRYMGERGQKFGEWGKEEDLRYQNALDRLEAQFGSLAGREGILGQRAGLKQDERNYLFNELWRNKDFSYAAQQDALERAYRNNMDSKTFNEDTRRYNQDFGFGKSQADKNYELALQQMTGQNYAYNPYNW